MPIYINGKKYVGGYMNGKKVNGYINGIQLFSYTTTVHVNFSNGSSQTLDNVPLGNQNLNNYGLSIPYGYHSTGNTSFNIDSGSSVTVTISPNTYTAYITYKNSDNNTVGSTIATVEYGESYSPSELGNQSIPSGYNNAGNNYNIQKCTGDMYFTFYVKSTNITVTVITKDSAGTYVGQQSVTLKQGSSFSPRDYVTYDDNNGYIEGEYGVTGGETGSYTPNDGNVFYIQIDVINF